MKSNAKLTNAILWDHLNESRVQYRQIIFLSRYQFLTKQGKIWQPIIADH